MYDLKSKRCPDLTAKVVGVRSLSGLEAGVGAFQHACTFMHGHLDDFFIGGIRSKLVQERFIVHRGLIEVLLDAAEMLGWNVCHLRGMMGL